MNNKSLGLYLTSDGFGGLEMNAVNLGKWMKARGWKIVMFTTFRSRVHQSAEKAGLECSFVNKPNKYFDIRNAFILSKLLRKEEIDRIIIFDNHDLSTANYCKKFFLSHLKMIYLQQMQFKVSKKSPAHTFRFSGLNYWISPLESLKKQVMKTTRVPEDKIKVIPLCLETERFADNSVGKADARKELNLKEDKNIIGVIGRIAPTKGQLGVIESFAQIAEKYPKAELLIMGEPTINEAQCIDYDKKCREFVRNNGLTEKVHFRPFREEVEYFYSAIDLFIMPSKKETFGMVTIEAMLSELPIIGTKSGGTPELLENGKFGQLFSFGDVHELSEKIENYFLKKFNYDSILEEAKNTAIKNYDAEFMCIEIEKLLD